MARNYKPSEFRNSLLGVLIGLVASISGYSTFAQQKKPKIFYRQLACKQAYFTKQAPDRSPRRVEIKVTPPYQATSGTSILVEIYNHTQRNLGLVDFELRFQSRFGNYFDSKVSGEDILRGRSAIRRIALKKHKNTFPKVTGVRIFAPQIYDDDAKRLPVDIYVDLVRC